MERAATARALKETRPPIAVALSPRMGRSHCRAGLRGDIAVAGLCTSSHGVLEFRSLLETPSVAVSWPWLRLWSVERGWADFWRTEMTRFRILKRRYHLPYNRCRTRHSAAWSPIDGALPRGLSLLSNALTVVEGRGGAALFFDNRTQLIGSEITHILVCIVRLHQHGACINRNRRQSMGRSRGADSAQYQRPRP